MSSLPGRYPLVRRNPYPSGMISRMPERKISPDCSVWACRMRMINSCFRKRRKLAMLSSLARSWSSFIVLVSNSAIAATVTFPSGRTPPSSAGTEVESLHLGFAALELLLERPPVRQELLLAAVGQCVLEELLEDLERHRRNVGARERGGGDVERMAQARRQDGGGEPVGAVDL